MKLTNFHDVGAVQDDDDFVRAKLGHLNQVFLIFVELKLVLPLRVVLIVIAILGVALGIEIFFGGVIRLFHVLGEVISFTALPS